MSGYKRKKYPIITNIDPESCMTTEQVAEMYGCTSRNIRRYCRWGKMPYAVGPCNRIIINKRAAILFLELRKQKARHDRKYKIKPE